MSSDRSEPPPLTGLRHARDVQLGEQWLRDKLIETAMNLMLATAARPAEQSERVRRAQLDLGAVSDYLLREGRSAHD